MREFAVPPGMPAAVFRDKYARDLGDGRFETYADAARRMVEGNLALAPGYPDDLADRFRDLAVAGVIPMSGRHLQHGDREQPGRQAELFYNCTSAMFSWAVFLLLMKGCGVGRDYSSDMCWTNWDYLPECRFVLDGPDKDGKGGHPDYEDWIEPLAEARHKYEAESDAVRWFEVEDSAEGWAKVLMVMETAAFHKHNAETMFVFDFSQVRRAGAPLRGQQNRPASGPVPFIRALHRIMSVKGAGMKPWKQALHVDHYAAECVVVGGVRRSARDALKSVEDRDVVEFVDVKRGGFLWSANDTIGVTVPEFWDKARHPRPSHERRVFEAAASASYWDGTGEPGFINLYALNDHAENLDSITVDSYLSKSFVERIGGLHPRTRDMIAYHLEKAKAKKYRYCINPCGEIPLAIWGAYCDVGDVCLANCETAQEALEAVGIVAAALVRVNSMDCIYEAETRRTNRIGVSLTGIHEFAWRVYNLSFRGMISAGAHFWRFIETMRKRVETSANAEADRLGMVHPATYTCIKPSGTIGKIMACTEGAHLPAHRFYLRWILMEKGSEKARDHERRGYPVKDVSHRIPGSVVVGFPTCLQIAEEIPNGLFVTASEATPREQYAYLRLLERHWLGPDRRNGQISYTLKWRKDQVSYEEYVSLLLDEQPTVRCCSLMPEADGSAYAYLPEESVTEERYRAVVAGIRDRDEVEAYDSAALACEGGACPIELDIHERSIGT